MEALHGLRPGEGPHREGLSHMAILTPPLTPNAHAHLPPAWRVWALGRPSTGEPLSLVSLGCVRTHGALPTSTRPPVDAPAPQSCWTGGGQHLDCVLWRRLSSVIPASCLGQIPPCPGRGHVLAGATRCVVRMEPVSGQQAPGSPTKVLLPNLRPRRQHHVAGNTAPHSEHTATPK